MKVGLIFARIDFLRKMENISNEHIGLGYIANSLEKKGYQYKIIDGHFFDLNSDEMIDTIKNEKFDIIGFSILYSNFVESLNIINQIKKDNPSIFVYVGGQHVSFCPNDILKENENIDAVMLGEGEFTIIDLINAKEKKIELDYIPGLVFRKGNKIINTGWRKPNLKIEDYGKINRDILEKGLKEGITCSINIMAGRGCIFNCSFCTGNKIFNPYHTCSWRVKKVDTVISELIELLNTYGTFENLYEIINFCDLNFINETQEGLYWIDNFINSLEQKKLDIFFYIMTRVDSIVHHKERIHKLRECGLVQIEMGLEAGNNKGLSVYNKRISIDQSFEAVSFLRKERIDFGMSGFIMYHPFIKIEDLRQNANFLNKIEYWKIMFLLTKMALYPGAAITNKVKNSNLLYDTYSHYEVYDYRFEDPQVELLYTSLAERLPFELLNEISEGIVYIELQLNLIYRKIEKISNNNNNILLQLEYGETEIKDEIRKSKHLIFNFFMSILDLIEYNWNIKEFDTLIAVFSLEYTKANEKIINKYQEYSAYIEKLVEQIS